MAKSTSRPQTQQPTISNFFIHKPSTTPKRYLKQPNRSSSPIDLTLDDSDDDEAPPRKKQRAIGTAPKIAGDSSPAGPSGRQQAAEHAERWRFDSISPVKPKLRTPAEEAARKNIHEAFKKRLLGENSTFIVKKPWEASKSATDVEAESYHRASNETDDSGEDSDPAFTSFKEMLSKGKGKAPAAKKTAQEVGPSGQTWTPLEKQVRK